jgi:PhnB protein
MATFNPYLNFAGNTEEAFKFYKSVFGGEFTAIQRFKETPVADKVSAKEKEKIMHITLPIGKGNILMGTDALESMGHKLTFGNNFNISIEADSKEEAKRIYDGLSVGGKIETPIHDEFWGAYFGMFTDKFGTRWMINYTYPKGK